MIQTQMTLCNWIEPTVPFTKMDQNYLLGWGGADLQVHNIDG